MSKMRLQITGVIGAAGIVLGGMSSAARAQTSTSEAAETWNVERMPSIGENVAAHHRFRQALLRHASCDFQETPLYDVLTWFQSATEFTIVLDRKAFEESAIAIDTPVTYKASSVRLDTAIRQVLREYDLTWTITADGVVLVTTKTTADTMLDTRVYPVRDLVTVEHETYLTEEYETVMDLITLTTAPTSWSEVGGPGAIKPFPAASALVISQTREVHEEIEQLLASLRQVQALQGGRRIVTNSAEQKRLAALPAVGTAPVAVQTSERVYINQQQPTLPRAQQGGGSF